MKYKLGSAALVAFYLCAQGPVALTQDTQSTSTSQSSPTAVQKTATGEQTVTGCVAREGEQFVLKTDRGTYEFDTARDLTPYVGKKVRISGRWKATGVTTAAPVQGTGSGAAESTSGRQTTGAKSSATAAKSFTGDLHLHITGDVIGDCESPQQ
jgi:hypothetical protein